MKVTIEVEDELVAAVDRAIKLIGITRDAAFTESIRWWVDSMPRTDRWAFEAPQLQNDPDGKEFEEYCRGYGW